MSQTDPLYENMIWWFDQSSDSIGSGPGFCAGIVVSWILIRAQGGDFGTAPAKFGPPTMTLSNQQKQLIIQYQQQLVGTPGRATYEDMLQQNDPGITVLKALNVDTHKTYRTVTNTTSAQTSVLDSALYDDVELSGMAPYVAQRTTVARCFYIMRFRPAVEDYKKMGTGGHVIAIEVNGPWGAAQTFRLMDPNRGCYDVAGAGAFNTWLLNNFLPNSSYRQFYRKRIKVHPVIFPRPSASDLAALSFQSFVSSISNWKLPWS
jgi:hypothetical protein